MLGLQDACVKLEALEILDGEYYTERVHELWLPRETSGDFNLKVMETHGAPS